MDLVVRRTKGASPAFIRELMRRSAQFQIEQGGGGRPSWARRRRSEYLRSAKTIEIMAANRYSVTTHIAT